MDTDQLIYFTKVAQLEHMSNAALELNISQPALSMNIRRLELELGINLFDRHGKTITLNKYGRIFLTHAKALLDRIELAKKELADVKNIKSCIRIATFSLISFPGLMQCIYSCSEGLSIDNIFVNLDELADSLASGQVDLSIRGSEIQDERIASTILCDDELVMLLPKSHPLAGRGSVLLSEFAGADFAYSKKAGTPYSELASFSAQAGFEPRLAYSCLSVADLVAAVRCGSNLVALAPLRALAAYDTTDTVAVRVSSPKCYSHMYMYWAKSNAGDPTLDTVRKAVTGYFNSRMPEIVDGCPKLKITDAE